MFFIPPLKSKSVLSVFISSYFKSYCISSTCTWPSSGNYLHLFGAHPDDWANVAEVEMQRRALTHLESYKSLIQRATGERRNEVWFAFEEAKQKFQEDHRDRRHGPLGSIQSQGRMGPRKGAGKGYWQIW
jgi:hypothetical protein